MITVIYKQNSRLHYVTEEAFTKSRGTFTCPLRDGKATTALYSTAIIVALIGMDCGLEFQQYIQYLYSAYNTVHFLGTFVDDLHKSKTNVQAKI